ncbi:MAG: carbohydrate ABC transporter permease, partial [Deinococcus sp.]
MTGRETTPAQAGFVMRRETFSPVQWLLLAVFTLYCLLPLWWVFTTMFKDNGQLFSTFGLWFASPSHLLETLH